MIHQHATLEDTVYFWFAANDTSGSGGDGAAPLADVRLGGALGNAAPVLSPIPTLLSHANYPAGCYEVAVAATAANGFAADNVYGVFCTLAIDAQNPSGFIGSVSLFPIRANAQELGGQVVTAAAGITVNAEVGASAAAMDAFEDAYDGTGFGFTGCTIPTVTEVTAMAGTIGTLDALDTQQDAQHSSTQGQITAAFTEIKGATWSATDTLEAIRNAIPAGSDVLTELTAFPGDTPQRDQALMWLYMLLAQKRVTDNTAGEDRVHNGAGTVISEATITGDANSVTREKYGAVD